MKRYIFTCFVFIILISLFSIAMPFWKKDNAVPDFNFPQDVLKSAEKQMKSATISDGTVGQDFLNALLAGLRAYQEIEENNIEGQIDYIEKHTADVKLSQPDRALILALKARILKSYYENNSWRFRDRRTPGDSIALWSPEQFTDSIAELLKQAAVLAADVDVAQYIPKVLTEGDTRIFGNFASLFASWGDAKSEFYKLCQTGSPAFFYWLNMEKENAFDNPLDRIDFYKQYASYSWANLLLFRLLDDAPTGIQYPNTPDNPQNILRDSIVDAIEDAVAAHPDFPYNSYLTGSLKRVTAPSISISVNPYVPVGASFSIAVASYNIRNLDLEICRTSSRRLSDKQVKALKPFRVIKYETDSVFDNQTIDVVLPEPGIYALRTRLDSDKDYRVTFFEAAPFAPALLSCFKQGVAITTDFVTGAPVADVKVIGQAKAPQSLARTDADGIAWFSKWDNQDRWRHYVSFAYRGHTYEFDDDMSLNFYNPQAPKEQLNLNVLTDRALYHPGETLSWAVVAARKGTDGRKELLRNETVEVTFRNANNQVVATQNCRTDAMGRVDGSFDIPDDGLTGYFSVMARYSTQSAQTRVMVSDFKAPVFEVKIDSLKMSPRLVVIQGVATTFSGMPVADAEVRMNVSNNRPWLRDIVLFEDSTRTDGSGNFRFEIPAGSDAGGDWGFFAEVTVTDAAAQTATATRMIRFGKQYQLSVQCPDGNVSSEKPFNFKVIAKDVNNGTTVLDYRWQLRRDSKVVEEGRAATDEVVTLDLSDTPAGKYTISAEPVDESLADSSVSDDFTLYNIVKNRVPEGSIIFVPVSSLKVDSDLRGTQFSVGTPDETTYVYVAVATENGIHSMRNYRLAQGFTTIDIPLNSDKDHKVKVIAMKDGRTHVQDIDITRVEPKHLNIQVQSFRDRVTPGATETWRLRIVGEDASSAAAVATMYNQALDHLCDYTSYLNFRFYTPSWTFDDSDLPTYPSHLNASVSFPFEPLPAIYAPQFVYINQQGMMIRGRRMYKNRYTATSGNEEVREDAEEEVMYNMITPTHYASAAPMAANDAICDYVTTEFSDEEAPVQSPELEVEYREPEVLQAFWMPRLVADKEGVVTIEFTVPNANTTWAFHMFGWTSELLAAQFDATALASKPVMVQAAVPRFLRQGDSAVLRATVFNNTDSAATVETEFEIFNPADGKTISTVRNNVSLDAKGSAIVEAPVTASPGLASVGYRIKAVAGSFADGEQDIIPLLASSQMLVESKEFYFDAKGEPVSLTVPSAEDAVTTFQYCQNPVWTVVKALRGVQWEDYSMTGSVTVQLGSALLARHIITSSPRISSVLAQWKANPDSKALTSMLEKNEQLKMLLLNQTPWVQAAQSNSARMDALAEVLDSTRCEYVIAQSKKALENIQNPDGGFRWAKWSDSESSIWVTVFALQDLGAVNSLASLPGELSPIARSAFRFVEQSAVAQEKNRWLHSQYALIASRFPQITPSEPGKRLLDKVCRSLSKEWRSMNLSDKAYTALILNALGNPDEARHIISSIEQYGKLTPGRGLEFPAVKDMRSYGNIIQAVAKVTPGNPILDLMRQWVILQAQATDDLGACNPDYIISSVLLTGSVWCDMTSVQPITINGTPAVFPEAELGTGYLTAHVEPASLIRIAPTGVTPSYGSIVSVFTAPMNSVPSFRTDDLEISKRMMVQRDGKWVETTVFRFGEEVQVQLQIRARRLLEYVAVIDERPAGFEPREQLPGWLWSNGIGFYRENRDASTRLFIGYLPKGSYSLTYTMTAATTGTFASGVATLQSQYDPALTAHSSGTIITIE